MEPPHHNTVSCYFKVSPGENNPRQHHGPPAPARAFGHHRLPAPVPKIKPVQLRGHGPHKPLPPDTTAALAFSRDTPCGSCHTKHVQGREGLGWP